MKAKVQYIIYFCMIWIASGCVSEFHADIPYTDEDILVIEGNIIANTEVVFILSKTFALSENVPPEGYNDVRASVVIVGSNGYRSNHAEYHGQGVHRISVGELSDNAEYHVEIEYNGYKYESVPQKPLHTPEIDDLTPHQYSEAGDVFIRVSTHQESNNFSYCMWEYEEDWEYSAQYYVNEFYNPVEMIMKRFPDAPYYYCWRYRRGKEILISSTESLTENRIKNFPLRRYESSDERFSILYSIRIKQVSITKSAYEYYQNLAKLSEDMGGLFTPQPSEIKGNVNCVNDKSRKVIGYINVIKNITEKQLYIQSKDISKEPKRETCLYLTEYQAKDLMQEMGIGYHDFYLAGYWPIAGESLSLATAWSTPYCIDCTTRGGTKHRPSFWPNNHY